MASVKSISAAMSSVNAKKENLRKAFEVLQAHSSSLASFTLQWKDLEDHFDSIQKSIQERFKELESKEKQVPGNQKSPSSSKLIVKKEEDSQVVANSHPEMKALIVNMEGTALRTYITNHRKEFGSMRDEVAVAIQSSLDPGKLVLDAMHGFYPYNSKGDKDGELAALRRTSILLLEVLASISTNIKTPVKERAKKLAVEWKGKLSTSGENPLEVLAFLQLLATYDLISAFNADEIIDLVATISRRKQAVDLFRGLGIADKAPDLIQKLSNTGKQLDAVKFAFAFELVDKFPPVPLLKGYVKECKNIAVETRKKGNHSIQAQNEAVAKEIAGLRAILKCIEEYKLESQYPRESLDKRIEQLGKQKAERKRPAAAPAPKSQQQQQMGNKRSRPNQPAAQMTVASTSTVASFTQAPLQQPGFVSDRVNQYLSAPAALYSLQGPTPPVSSYMSSSVGPYGFVGTPMGYGGNLSPTRSHFYSSEPHTSGLYDRSASYGGPGLLPQYRPSYYP